MNYKCKYKTTKPQKNIIIKPHGACGLTVLDDETRCWLNNITASI